MPWISGEAEVMWRNAVSPVPSERKTALSYWARHLDMLPGPLFFELDPANVLRGEWQRVVRASEPRCPCAARRWFIPTHSQPFYEPVEPELFTLGAGRPQLAIAPWGGDTVATMVQLAVEGGDLLERMAPYSLLSHDQLRQIGFGTLEDVQRAADNTLLGAGSRTSNLSQRTPLTQIAEQFTGTHLAVPSAISVGEVGSTDIFEFRCFAIYGVDAAADTVTVAVSRNCQRVNPADRGRIHVCA